MPKRELHFFVYNVSVSTVWFCHVYYDHVNCNELTRRTPTKQTQIQFFYFIFLVFYLRFSMSFCQCGKAICSILSDVVYIISFCFMYAATYLECYFGMLILNQIRFGNERLNFVNCFFLPVDNLMTFLKIFFTVMFTSFNVLLFKVGK